MEGGEGGTEKQGIRKSSWRLTDGVYLSEKGKSIFIHRLAKLMKRVLKLPGEGNLHPSHSYKFDASASKGCPELHRSAGRKQKGISATAASKSASLGAQFPLCKHNVACGISKRS